MQRGCSEASSAQFNEVAGQESISAVGVFLLRALNQSPPTDAFASVGALYS